MSELIDRQALLDSVYKNLPMIPSMAGMTAEEMRLRIAVLIENAPTASPWRMAEEPPVEEKDYLTWYVDGYCCVNYWSKQYGWGYDDEAVRYWMPIEPPKEDE